MPSEWYLMSTPLFSGDVENDEFTDFAIDGFEEVLSSIVADDVEIYDKKIYTEPLTARAIIQGVTTDSYANSVQRQFICKIGTLKSGQYIKAKNRFWLVYSPPDNNKMYEKAIGWLCKYSIKFISPLTNEIVEYPVYDINSTQYGSGETSKEHMTVGTSQHIVYISYNEETVLIDSGFRFLIDKNKQTPTAYRVTQVDTYNYADGEQNGVIQLTLVESQYDENTDNKELMIADYYQDDKPEDDNNSNPDYMQSIKLIPEFNNNNIIFGESLKIYIEFYLNGEVAAIPELKISITDGNEYGEITEIKDNYFIVKALNNRSYINQEIAVLVENNEFNINETIILKIKGWY